MATMIANMADDVTVGQLAPDSLVWDNRVVQWTKTGIVDELKKTIRNAVIPILQNEYQGIFENNFNKYS